MIKKSLSGLIAVGLTSSVALAGGGKAGLPQLDIAWFPGQIFWLLVIFGFVYIVLGHGIAPKIGAVIESRNARIQNDLREAEELIKQANAQKMHAQSAAFAASQQAKNQVLEALKIANEKIHQAEMQDDEKLQKIWAQKTSDMQTLRNNFLKTRDTSAQQIAAQLVERLSGMVVDPKNIKVQS